MIFKVSIQLSIIYFLRVREFTRFPDQDPLPPQVQTVPFNLKAGQGQLNSASFNPWLLLIQPQSGHAVLIYMNGQMPKFQFLFMEFLRNIKGIETMFYLKSCFCYEQM